MEPITHLMTGACLARAGFNRKAAYATLAMTLAAEAPDLDTLWSVRGPVAAFQHHRGITHTFLGLPFEAALVTGAVYLYHRYRLHRATHHSQHSPLPQAPIRWPLLYAFTLLALLSHILLDWTNNYGVRPFFPFNPHWYADSIVFIFEPVLFAILLLALTAPALFGLINAEVGARKPAFRGRGWAIFALVAMVALWGWRQVEHDAAIRLATASTASGSGDVPSAEVLRVTASPYPANPYRWHTVVETPAFYQLATINTLHPTVDTNPGDDLLYKPAITPATLAATQSWLGRVYLDWSTWPIVTDAGPTSTFESSSTATPPGTTSVTFHDLRFTYDTFLMNGRQHPPLSATVYLNPDHTILQMEMDGRPQK